MVFLFGALFGLVLMYVACWLPGSLSPHATGYANGHCVGWCEAQDYPGGVVRGTDCHCFTRVEAP